MLLDDGSRESKKSGSKVHSKDRKRKKERNSRKKDPVELSLLFAATTTTNKEEDHLGVFLSLLAPKIISIYCKDDDTTLDGTTSQ